MADRRENSVLFSLRELRNIEEERVKTEEEAEKARLEAERRAREEEIRLAKEAEEAKIRAEEERVRREQLDRERIAHDAQVKLQEAQHRAQVEAATKLEQARIEADARVRIEGKKFPIGAVVGGVVGLVALAGGIMGYLVHQHNVELAQQQASLQAKHEAEQKALKAQLQDESRKLKEELADLQGQLDKASNDAERAQIRAKMLAASETHRRAAAVAAKKLDEGKKPKAIKTDTSDPLGGLNL
jgi:hypothetical protein